MKNCSAWFVVVSIVVGLMACEGQLGLPPGPTPLPAQQTGQPAAPVVPQSPVAQIDAGQTTPPQMEQGGPSIESFSCAPSTAEVNKPLACQALARHPNALALRCQLESSIGGKTVDLGDCSTLQMASLSFDAPGPVTLSLLATDTNGKVASQMLGLQITAKANQPPVIANFAATPKTGAAPLKSTLSFEVSDPDNDKLSCAVDVGNDGSVEFPTVDCGSKQLPVEVTKLGVTPVKLTVTDANGLAVDAQVSLEAKASSGDLKFGTIEFGQTILKEKLRLVEGKAVLLKVGVLATQANVVASVEVEAKMGATSLGKKAMEAPATVPMVETRYDLSKNFRLTLPVEWVAPGVSLTVRIDPQNELLEADETNNEAVVALEVGRGNVLHLTTIPIIQGGLTGELIDLVPSTLRMWPFKAVEVRNRAPVTLNRALQTGDDSWSQGLSQLENIRRTDGSRRNYLGMVSLNPNTRTYTAGIGYIGNGVSLAIDGPPNSNKTDVNIALHELGHNFNLPHAPCNEVGGTIEGVDPNYPNKQGKVGSFGYDGMKVIGPNDAVDVMTYCEPRYISDYNYGKVQRFVESKSEYSAQALEFRAGASAPQDTLNISGIVSASGASFAPAQRIEAVPLVLQPSDTEVVLLLTDGREMRVPVTLDAIAEANVLHFSTIIANPGPVAKMTLRHGVDVLAEQTAGLFQMAPTATVERVNGSSIRVRWTGGRFASVAHLRTPSQMLFVEAQNLEPLRRTTLTVGASGGEIVLAVDTLAGGDLEVSVSDGVQSKAVRLPMP